MTSAQKWLVGGLFVVVVFAGMVIGIFTLFANSDVCQSAMQMTRNNDEATALLGTPIEKGLLISGKIEISGPSGHAELSIPVHGPKGKGNLYAIATKKLDIWSFETLQLAVDGRPARLDLLPEGKPGTQ